MHFVTVDYFAFYDYLETVSFLQSDRFPGTMKTPVIPVISL